MVGLFSSIEFLYKYDIMSLINLNLTEVTKLKLDGFGLFVDDMPTMVRFYRDVLGFEITEGENAEMYILSKMVHFLCFMNGRTLRK